MERTDCPFNPVSVLATAGKGRSCQILEIQKVFAKGEVADADLYIQKTEVKVAIVSSPGTEAVISIVGNEELFGKGCVVSKCDG